MTRALPTSGAALMCPESAPPLSCRDIGFTAALGDVNGRFGADAMHGNNTAAEI